MTLNRQETLLIGGPDHFATVRHLVLSGSNFEIGRALGEIAQQRYQVQLEAPSQGRVTQARHLYYQQHYPIHLERARGVAAAYGLESKDMADPTALHYPTFPLSPAAGCSVVYYPPHTTERGHGLLSRNFDFSTKSLPEILGLPVPPGVRLPPAVGEPYVMEVYPDQGYPSLYLACFDLLGACLDGINAAGLTVALLGNFDPTGLGAYEPMRENAVGIDELQVARLLLDTCATVEEALLTLTLQKHYYVMMPCHYLISDRMGRSVVWEYSPAHNREYVSAGNGRPQVVTNHPLYLHKGQQEPTDSESVKRYQLVQQRLGEGSEPYSLEFLKQTNACVFADDQLMQHLNIAFETAALATRTLWHTIYDTTEPSLEASFYLRDEPDPLQGGQTTAARSHYFHFQLARP